MDSTSQPSPPNDTTTPALDPVEWQSAQSAFEAHAAEIAAVHDDEMLPVNVDFIASMSIIGSNIDRLMAYRAQIAAIAPSFDVSCFDKLLGYTRAARWAQVVYSTASQPLEPMQKLVDDTLAARERLIADVEVLAKRRLIDPAYANDLRGINGHRNIAFDAFLLAGVLRQSWAKVEGKTAVTMTEIEEAERLGEQLSNEIEKRERRSEERAQAVVVRQKAFTLVANAYSQVRRAIQFLRWNEGDVDEIAPTLYAKTRGKKRVATEDTVVPPIVTPIVGPSPTPAPAPSPAKAGASDDPFTA